MKVMRTVPVQPSLALHMCFVNYVPVFIINNKNQLAVKYQVDTGRNNMNHDQRCRLSWKGGLPLFLFYALLLQAVYKQYFEYTGISISIYMPDLDTVMCTYQRKYENKYKYICSLLSSIGGLFPATRLHFYWWSRLENSRHHTCIIYMYVW